MVVPSVVQSQFARQVCDATEPLCIIMSRHGVVYVHQGPNSKLYASVRGFKGSVGLSVLRKIADGLQEPLGECYECDTLYSFEAEHDDPSEPYVRELHVRLA